MYIYLYIYIYIYIYNGIVCIRLSPYINTITFCELKF